MRRRTFVGACAAALPVARALAADGEKANPLGLWHPLPAANWLQALPLGNGRLGGMVFGGIATERVVLNEHTAYAEEPDSRDLPLDITSDSRFATRKDETVLVVAKGTSPADFRRAVQI
jgi:hypothetical protein